MDRLVKLGKRNRTLLSTIHHLKCITLLHNGSNGG